MQILQKLVYTKFYTKKFYIHEIAAIDLSKIYFLKNTKKTCKPNSHNLNRDWISNDLFEETNERHIFCKVFYN